MGQQTVVVPTLVHYFDRADAAHRSVDLESSPVDCDSLECPHIGLVDVVSLSGAQSLR